MGVRWAILALAMGAAATVGQAAPYQAVSDADGLWLLDEGSGALTLCRTVATTGPKVVDVFGGTGEARPMKALPARADCVAARPGSYGTALGTDTAVPGLGAYGFGGPLSVAVRPGMLGDGSSGYQVGSAVGMLGDGNFGYGYGGFDNQVIYVQPERYRGAVRGR